MTCINFHYLLPTFFLFSLFSPISFPPPPYSSLYHLISLFSVPPPPPYPKILFSRPDNDNGNKRTKRKGRENISHSKHFLDPWFRPHRLCYLWTFAVASLASCLDWFGVCVWFLGSVSVSVFRDKGGLALDIISSITSSYTYLLYLFIKFFFLFFSTSYIPPPCLYYILYYTIYCTIL